MLAKPFVVAEDLGPDQGPIPAVANRVMYQQRELQQEIEQQNIILLRLIP